MNAKFRSRRRGARNRSRIRQALPPLQRANPALQHVFEEPHYLRTGEASEAGIIDRIGDEEMPGTWDHHGADEETRLFESGKKRRGLCRRINNVVMVAVD